jgi:hypothetical protein
VAVVRGGVRRRFGIELELEVRFVGAFRPGLRPQRAAG